MMVVTEEFYELPSVCYDSFLRIVLFLHSKNEQCLKNEQNS